MTHLTSDELIDAMEVDTDESNAARMLAPERRSHLATCETCRQQLAELSGVLHEAKQASVPEPSPLFWQHFSQRVRVQIDHETAPGSNWPSWLRWQILLPLGAAAIIVLGLMTTMPSDDRVRDIDTTVDSSTGDVDLAVESWTAVADLVGPFDIEAASAAGVIEPGVAERAVLELTAEEQQELTRLLKAELTRAKS